MKRLFSALLLAYGTSLAAQPANLAKDNNPVLSSDQFMIKSKQQNTAAYLLLSGGIGLIAAAGLLVADETATFLMYPLDDQVAHNTGTSEVLFILGVGAMAGSIPFFIASGKNKRRSHAASASIDVKKQYQIQLGSVKPILYPALSIKFSL